MFWGRIRYIEMTWRIKCRYIVDLPTIRMWLSGGLCSGPLPDLSPSMWWPILAKRIQARTGSPVHRVNGSNAGSSGLMAVHVKTMGKNLIHSLFSLTIYILFYSTVYQYIDLTT